MIIIKMNTLEIINKVRNFISFNSTLYYLKKPGVLEWLFAEPTFISSLTKKKEDEWGKSIIGYSTGQWTTKLGESILQEILHLANKQPSRLKTDIISSNGKRLIPDFIATDGLYENKARTYTTTGTAGEKILGAPTKYCECKRLYKLPLNIVCMAYQEIEADKSFQLFKPQTPELRQILDFYDKNLGIRYVRATDLLIDAAQITNKE